MRKPRPAGCGSRSRSVAATIWFVVAIAVVGCWGGQRSATPTSPAAPAVPAPPPVVGAVTWWAGAWTPEGVGPAGYCLADELQAWTQTSPRYSFELAFGRLDEEVSLSMNWGGGNDADEGFWPLEYRGKIGSDGAISAQIPADWVGLERHDPWLELCAFFWTTVEGRLEAKLSADGRHLSGTVVETYRATTNGTGEPGTFTVRSKFDAELR